MRRFIQTLLQVSRGPERARIMQQRNFVFFVAAAAEAVDGWSSTLGFVVHGLAAAATGGGDSEVTG